MPCGAQWAFKWIYEVGMPILLGESTIKMNRLCITDGDPHEYHPLKICMNNPSSPWYGSKHGLCEYHLLFQGWMKHVRPSIPSNQNEIQHICKIFYHMLCSLFFYIETQQEYDFIHKTIFEYLKKEEVTNLLGDNLKGKLLEFLTIHLFPYSSYFARYHRINVFGFDQETSSIVESLNKAMKVGECSVKPRYSLDHSSKAIVGISNHSSKMKAMKNAKQINSMKPWTRSETASYLTPYAEGIAIKLFDRGLKQVYVQVSSNDWYVMSPNLNDEGTTEDKSILSKVKVPKFRRVRHVFIQTNNGKKYMKCSCGFYQRHGQPCEHIFSIIKVNQPQFHHVRYHQTFSYYYGRKAKFTNKFNILRNKIDVSMGLLIDDITTPTFEKYPIRSENCTENHEKHIFAILRYSGATGLPVHQNSDEYLKYNQYINEDKSDMDHYQGLSQTLSQPDNMSTQCSDAQVESYIDSMSSMVHETDMNKMSLFNQMLPHMKEQLKKVESFNPECQQKFLPSMLAFFDSFNKEASKTSTAKNQFLNTSTYVSMCPEFSDQPKKAKRLKPSYKFCK